MEETVRIKREHPLETPVGTLYAEFLADDAIVVTSGRVEHNWLTGKSWGFETVRVRRRDWRVQVKLYEHGDGSFAVGVPGRKPLHSEYGDYFIAVAEEKLFDRFRRRKYRKAIKQILEAATAAVNALAVGDDLFEQARADDVERRRRARLFSLQRKLDVVEQELAELPGKRQALERRQVVLEAQRDELAAEAESLSVSA